MVARRLGEQLAKREEAVAGREVRQLESVQAKHAGIAERVTKLEAKEKALASSEQCGDTDLADRLATAQDTLSTLEWLVQDQAGEIGAICLANNLGPGLL